MCDARLTHALAEIDRLEARIVALEARQQQIIVLLDSTLDDIEWGEINVHTNHVQEIESLLNVPRISAG